MKEENSEIGKKVLTDGLDQWLSKKLLDVLLGNGIMKKKDMLRNY